MQCATISRCSSAAIRPAAPGPINSIPTPCIAPTCIHTAFRAARPRLPVRPRCVTVHAGLDQLAHAAQHAADALPAALHHAGFLTLGDVADGAANAVQAATDAAQAAAPAAQDDGWFGWLADGFEAILKVLDSGLEKLNVPYSYGFAIILLTVMVKVATFPLSKAQVESTISMQALQPRVRDLQARYKNDPEKLQLETARVYREAGVNPLAGCLPTIATIPVFIGLYKALSNVADEGLLKEGFFWIPSLGGPTTMAMQAEGGGLSWLFPFKDGAPPVGWEDAGAYLVLPLLLVVSQWASQKIISPPVNKDDPAQQQTQAILAFLPVLIGWFSLNVPSGLTLYWLTNNILTTGQQVWLRSRAKPAMAGGATVDVSTPASSSTRVVDVEAEEVKPSGRDLDARGKKKKAAAAAEVAASGFGANRRGEKFRQVKAREAARKAAQQATTATAAAKDPAHSGEEAKESVPIEAKKE